MYAVFEDGSRQYRVSQGDRVRLDHRDSEIGQRIELSRVLLYANGDQTEIGSPVVEGARVIGEVVSHPSVKSYIQKFRRRKTYRRFRGHRQHFVELEIKYILLKGEDVPPEEEKPTESAPEQPSNDAPTPDQQAPSEAAAENSSAVAESDPPREEEEKKPDATA